MHILKALPAAKNRTRIDFANAIHVIENLNVSEFTVTAQIRSYASIEAYNYREKPDADPNRNDGRVIMERHETFGRKLLDLTNVVSEDPYEQMKEAAYSYIAANCEEYKGGTVVNE